MATCLYEPDVEFIEAVQPKPELEPVIKEIRELQRQRVCTLKSRIMFENRLVATVATMHGYHAGMEEKERGKRFKEAAALINAIHMGQTNGDPVIANLVTGTFFGIDAFDGMVKQQEKQLKKLARRLPVIQWTEHKDQKGFGVLQLAIIVGECGDLGNYANPGKLWKRMGCAPFESNGVMRMPSTWRRKKSLSAAEWEEIGYCPRRRSIMFLVAEGLMKLNDLGPYRRRWLEAKVRCYEMHPEVVKGDWDWRDCTGELKRDKVVVSKCVGGTMVGERQGQTCRTCGGTGKTCGHALSHALLLTGKRLLRNLWREWNK